METCFALVLEHEATAVKGLEEYQLQLHSLTAWRTPALSQHKVRGVIHGWQPTLGCQIAAGVPQHTLLKVS
jgi:hypothetical protein